MLTQPSQSLMYNKWNCTQYINININIGTNPQPLSRTYVTQQWTIQIKYCIKYYEKNLREQRKASIKIRLWYTVWYSDSLVYLYISEYVLICDAGTQNRPYSQWMVEILLLQVKLCVSFGSSLREIFVTLYLDAWLLYHTVAEVFL